MEYLAEYKYNGLHIRVSKYQGLGSYYKGRLRNCYSVMKSRMRPDGCYMENYGYLRLGNAIRKFHRLIKEANE